jgi:hypothetical protein
VTIFTDVEFVSIQEAEPPDEYAVAFDVIYAGETWCRSLVGLETAVAARVERDEYEMIRLARDALLERLSAEAVPVSLHLRLGVEGVTVLARGRPGR